MTETPGNSPRMRQSNLSGNNRWPGPETIDICRQTFRQPFQEIGFKSAKHPFKQRIFAVIRRTNPPFDMFPRVGLARVYFAEPGTLGACQTVAERAPIDRAHKPRGDIIEEHCECPHTDIVESLGLVNQDVNRLALGKT